MFLVALLKHVLSYLRSASDDNYANKKPKVSSVHGFFFLL